MTQKREMPGLSDERCVNDIDVCSPTSCAAKPTPQLTNVLLPARQVPFFISIAEVRRYLHRGERIEPSQQPAGQSDTASSGQIRPDILGLSSSLNSNDSVEDLFASSGRFDESTANDDPLHPTDLHPPRTRRVIRSNTTTRSLLAPPRCETEKREAFGRLSVAIEDVAELVKDAQYLEMFNAAKAVFDAWGRNSGPGPAHMAGDLLADDYPDDWMNWRGRAHHDE